MDNSFKEINFRTPYEKPLSVPAGQQPANASDDPLFRRDEIIYDEGWRAPSESGADPLGETPVSEPVALDEQKPVEKPKKPIPALLSFQLILCILAALALFVLKSLDSDWYHVFSDWFDGEMSKTLISQKSFDDVDMARLFRQATPDESTATEIPSNGSPEIKASAEGK